MTTDSALAFLFRDLDDLFRGMPLASSTGFSAPTDVRSNKDGVTVQVDLPGVKREDVRVTVEDRILTISGERKYTEPKDERVTIQRSFGKFRKTWTLPAVLDETKLTANLADGVLTVHIPKAETAKPRQVLVNVS